MAMALIVMRMALCRGRASLAGASAVARFSA